MKPYKIMKPYKLIVHINEKCSAQELLIYHK